VSTPSLKVVVAVTSPIAFQPLLQESILNAALLTARAFTTETGIPAHLAIATLDATKVAHFGCEILECDPNQPGALAAAIKGAAQCDLVAIHDSQRPLTRTTQFHRALAALIAGVDAVRPASAFTETLKVVNADATIERTIERTSMLRIATPEIIRFSAIDFAGSSSTWFVPLKTDAKQATVAADPESFRVNSLAEIALAQTLAQLN